jgi:hypothetical protein
MPSPFVYPASDEAVTHLISSTLPFEGFASDEHDDPPRASEEGRSRSVGQRRESDEAVTHPILST